MQVAPYFSKVECFCFEEQRLLAGEEVDMPLLFFIDKDILDDPACKNVEDVVLSYTFFRLVLYQSFESERRVNHPSHRSALEGTKKVKSNPMRMKMWCKSPLDLGNMSTHPSVKTGSESVLPPNVLEADGLHYIL